MPISWESAVFPQGDMDALFEELHDLEVDCHHLEGGGPTSSRAVIRGLLLAARNCESEEDVDAVHALWAASCSLPIPSRR